MRSPPISGCQSCFRAPSPRWPLIGIAILSIGFAAPARAEPKTVTILTDRHQVDDAQVYADFTKETGIAVEVVDREPDVLIDALEPAPAPAPADLVFAVGAAQLCRIADRGALTPLVRDPLIDAIPANMKDPGGRWTALTYWARVLVYRTDRFTREDVSRYQDLADPKFDGQILARSGASPYNVALTAGLIAEQGLEETETWARAVVSHFARPPQGGDSNQIEALSRGDGGVALVNTRYWGRFAGSTKVTAKETVDGLAVAFPDQAGRGTMIDIAGAGILARAAHPEAARQLLLYLLRGEVQAKLAGTVYDYPARPDVAAVEPLAALGPFKPDPLPAATQGHFATDAAALLAKAGWE
jgi:iron(III) transport system substrate-binding protein